MSNKEAVEEAKNLHKESLKEAEKKHKEAVDEMKDFIEANFLD